MGLLFCSWGDRRFQETTYVENPLDRRAWQAPAHGGTRVRHGLVTKPPPLPYTHQERAEGREPPHEPTAKMVLSPEPIQVYHSQPPAFILYFTRAGKEKGTKVEKGGGRRAVKDYFFLDFLLINLTVLKMNTLTRSRTFFYWSYFAAATAKSLQSCLTLTP